MNKKILFLASLSVILQLIRLMFAYMGINILWHTILISIYILVAFLSTIFLAFQNRHYGLNNNVLNMLGIILTLPIVFILMITYKSLFFKNQETEIDSNSIKMFDKNDKEIPTDSLLFIMKNDSNSINRIQLIE